MRPEKLFHISDKPKIKIFEPLPAPFYPGVIRRNVVFAITDALLHNYLLPRDCPRITYYAGRATTPEDRSRFFGYSTARYIITVESGRLNEIQRAMLYCYEFPAATFSLFDKNAGYYISYKSVVPLSVRPVYNVMDELLKRNVELRFTPEFGGLAEAVANSTLNYSLIRMRHLITTHHSLPHE
jgi:hypothetical protein